MCSPPTNFTQLRLPAWIASLLRAAKRLRSDCARRKKVYRLLHRKLVCAHAVIQISIHSHLFLSLHLLFPFKTLMTVSFPPQMSQGFGMKELHVCQPTYVYPTEVKMLLRSVFFESICDYPDPCHNNVSVNFIHDLLLLFSSHL